MPKRPEFETIPCDVHITCVATGETRPLQFEWVLPNAEGFSSRFIWEEGNFSCDCNRSMFFAEAAGEEDPDMECSDGRYTVVIKDAVGNILYQDEKAVQ